MEGSEEIYKMKEKDAQTIHREWMSQAEIDREITEIRRKIGVLVMLLEENQRQVWVLKRKLVRWHKLYKLQRRLQEKRSQHVNMQLVEEIMKLEHVLDVQQKYEELREIEMGMEVSICELEQSEVLGEEEGITDEFLNYWKNADQQEQVKPCIDESDNFDLITRFVEDEQSLEAVKSMGEYLSEDKNSKVKEDGECLLNVKISDVLQQRELNNALIFETVTTMEKFLMK